MWLMEGEITKPLLFPSSRGGVDVTSKRHRRRRSLTGADGVVRRIRPANDAERLKMCWPKEKIRKISDHPVCACIGRFAAFIGSAATPPLEEGNRESRA